MWIGSDVSLHGGVTKRGLNVSLHGGVTKRGLNVSLHGGVTKRGLDRTSSQSDCAAKERLIWSPLIWGAGPDSECMVTWRSHRHASTRHSHYSDIKQT